MRTSAFAKKTALKFLPQPPTRAASPSCPADKYSPLAEGGDVDSGAIVIVRAGDDWTFRRVSEMLDTWALRTRRRQSRGAHAVRNDHHRPRRLPARRNREGEGPLPRAAAARNPNSGRCRMHVHRIRPERREHRREEKWRSARSEIFRSTCRSLLESSSDRSSSTPRSRRKTARTARRQAASSSPNIVPPSSRSASSRASLRSFAATKRASRRAAIICSARP